MFSSNSMDQQATETFRRISAQTSKIGQMKTIKDTLLYQISDVLWCQPIKLIHVVSTSEFHKY